MQSALERFKNSTVWDKRYDLPLVPGSQNPWIYMAYVDLIIQSHGEKPLDRGEIHKHYLRCGESTAFRGLIHRFPDGSGGMTSHDELMGVAYFDQLAAMEICSYLNRTDGVYVNHPAEFEERYNLYRFPWFVCYLRSRAGFRIGLLHHLSWAVRLVIDYFTFKPEKGLDQDGRLMTWLMMQEMKKYWWHNILIRLWITKMDKYACSPKRMFSSYLADHREFFELAPNYYSMNRD